MSFRSNVVALAALVLVLGAGFGAATSLINDVSSPYGLLGSRLVDTDWAWVAGVASVTSKLVDQGWAWAALAVAAGWLAGTSVVRGALAGVVALLAATAAYLGMDAVLLDNSLAWFWRGMLRWWFASAVFGPPLGAMGANIKRPGVIGLLAGLTVPTGAAVQMIVLPPSSTPPTGVPGAICARVIVWVASAAAAGVVITRFGAAKSGRR